MAAFELQPGVSRRDLKRCISVPREIDAGIAEITGAIIGDGHLHAGQRGTTTDYCLSIAFNSTEDRPYIEYLARRFKEKFGVMPRIRLRSHCNELLLRSKGIVSFFTNLGIKAGRKAPTIKIPNEILEHQELTCACVRGIFDTDFSLTFKRKYRDVHYYPVISLSSVSKNLRDQVRNILDDFAFKNAYCFDRVQVTRMGTPVQEYELYISGVDELERWMALIGTSNPRHETKYRIWKRFGFCPPGTTLAQRFAILNGSLSPNTFYKNGGESLKARVWKE